MNATNIWKQLADPRDLDAQRDVAGVRERLDTVCPGEWDLTFELLPSRLDAGDVSCSFKARVQILGVIREGIGTGADYKTAAMNAFLDAAARFGLAVTTRAA